MGQGIGRVPEAPAVIGDGAGREPIGRYIAQQRRLRGIDLEELSARTRIPRRSLERLEAGAFDRSPDGFSRGFVRTVAEAIGLDADDAVARMLPEPDAAQLGPPRAALWIVAGVLVVLVAAAALVLRTHARAPAAPENVASGLPVRTDYVRALAEANGIHASELSGRDTVLAPPPPEPVEPEAPAASEVAAAPPPKAPAPKPATPSTRPAAAAPSASAPTPAPTPPPQASTPASAASELGAPPAPAPSASASAEATSAPPSPAPTATPTEAAAGDPPALDDEPSIEAVAPVPSPTPTPAEPESSPASDAEADD